MAVDQISVFLQNETGGVADAVGVLARAGVDIRALSLADESDFGVLRLIVDDTDRGVAAFEAAGFPVRRTPVVAVEIADRPGGLAKVLDAIRAVPVEYMYAFVRKSREHAIVVLRFDDGDRGVEALRAAGARLLDAAEIRAL